MTPPPVIYSGITKAAGRRNVPSIAAHHRLQHCQRIIMQHSPVTAITQWDSSKASGALGEFLQQEWGCMGDGKIIDFWRFTDTKVRHAAGEISHWAATKPSFSTHDGAEQHKAGYVYTTRHDPNTPFTLCVYVCVCGPTTSFSWFPCGHLHEPPDVLLLRLCWLCNSSLL